MDKFLAEVERRAFRTAMVATGDREEALDIVQDAMLKMVTKYQHKPREEWGALFHSILQSRIMDWYRRTKVRAIVRRFFGGQGEDEQDEQAAVPGRASDDPASLVSNEKAVGELENALHALPIRQQQAFVLRIWEGYDVADTAEIMGCSQGSVKTHLSRATQRLREVLGEHWL